MPKTEAQKRASRNYQKKHVRQRTVVFYPSDAELLEFYDSHENKQEYVRRLIREDMERVEREDPGAIDEDMLEKFAAAAMGNAMGKLEKFADVAVKNAMEKRVEALNGTARFRAVTFGNFAFYADGRLVCFHRKKSMEIFAYLLHRRGTVVPRTELAAVLYGDETYSKSTQKALDNAIHTLFSDLKEVDAEELVFRNGNGLAVDCANIHADLFDFLNGYTGLYLGEYMEQWPWAERRKRIFNALNGGVYD